MFYTFYPLPMNTMRISRGLSYYLAFRRSGRYLSTLGPTPEALGESAINPKWCGEYSDRYVGRIDHYK
jgi:hypothetical protein